MEALEGTVTETVTVARRGPPTNFHLLNSNLKPAATGPGASETMRHIRVRRRLSQPSRELQVLTGSESGWPYPHKSGFARARDSDSGSAIPDWMNSGAGNVATFLNFRIHLSTEHGT